MARVLIQLKLKTGFGTVAIEFSIIFLKVESI